ncbi:MAG: lysozyme [Alphaproteobacteria bacterium]
MSFSVAPASAGTADGLLRLRASAAWKPGPVGAQHASLPSDPILRLRASPKSPFVRRPASFWKTNAEAIEIIKNAERLRLEAYFLAGQWLIGYGHAGGVTEGMVITKARASQLLADDLKICEQTVGRIVDVPVTRNEFSALVALCYNIGGAKLARSHVVEHLNNRDRAQAANAFLHWRRVTIDDVSKVAASLVNRRHLERALFLTRYTPEDSGRTS